MDLAKTVMERVAQMTHIDSGTEILSAALDITPVLMSYTHAPIFSNMLKFLTIQWHRRQDDVLPRQHEYVV